MKKKLLSKTYLRDAENYKISFYIDEKNDYYLTVKKLLKVKSPFIVSTGEKLMDDGYYLVEITPKNENYNIRHYIDNNKNIVQTYIDLSYKNGLDEELKVPYYEDLYLDITITNGVVRILDEDELISAEKNGIITSDDLKIALSVKEKLLKEIDEKNNKYLNLELSEFLK
ncbi:MAG: DUF402 domain-containing protein [Clostridia bacterium]|nr:DUF402 domain-containing protein [Clostridia bacterium]